MRKNSDNAKPKTDFSSVNAELLISLFSQAIYQLKADTNGDIALKGQQYYYMLEPDESFMRELTMAPIVQSVGDITDDIEFIKAESERGISDPNYLLERLSHVIRFLASQDILSLQNNDDGTK